MIIMIYGGLGVWVGRPVEVLIGKKGSSTKRDWWEELTGWVIPRWEAVGQ